MPLTYQQGKQIKFLSFKQEEDITLHAWAIQTLAPYFLQGMQCCTEKCYLWAAIPESAWDLEHGQQSSIMPKL